MFGPQGWKQNSRWSLARAEGKNHLFCAPASATPVSYVCASKVSFTLHFPTVDVKHGLWKYNFLFMCLRFDLQKAIEQWSMRKASTSTQSFIFHGGVLEAMPVKASLLGGIYPPKQLPTSYFWFPCLNSMHLRWEQQPCPAFLILSFLGPHLFSSP